MVGGLRVLTRLGRERVEGPVLPEVPEVPEEVPEVRACRGSQGDPYLTLPGENRRGLYRDSSPVTPPPT